MLDSQAKERLQALMKEKYGRNDEEQAIEIDDKERQESVILEVTAYYLQRFGFLINKVKSQITKFVNSPDHSIAYVMDLA